MSYESDVEGANAGEREREGGEKRMRESNPADGEMESREREERPNSGSREACVWYERMEDGTTRRCADACL